MTAALPTTSSIRSLISKLFLFFILATCYLLLTTITFAEGEVDVPVTKEQIPDSSRSAIEPVTAANYGPDKHILFTLMNMGGYALGCLADQNPLFGGDCLDMVGKVGSNGADSGATPYLVNNTVRSGGALGAMGRAMAALGTTQPTSPNYYLASIGENFGISPAYAQVTGSGSGVIAPVMKLWQLTRNLAYFGFILIFMVIGFMIMFRQKLNPQTVISAQNALPGIVVALILVTFSYLIAALIIDLGFVTTQLTGRLLAANQLADEQIVNKSLREKNFFGIFGSLISPPAIQSENPGLQGVFDPLSDLNDISTTTAESLTPLNDGIVGTIIKTVATAGGCYVGTSITGSLTDQITAIPLNGVGRTVRQFATNHTVLAKGVGCAVGGGAGLLATTAGSYYIFYGLGIILYVVMIIALLIAMGRTFFELIKAYVTIMIQTVIGPIVIMMGAIPGQGGSFSGWAKTILANVLIFPAVFAALFFASFVMGRPDNTFGIPAGASGDFANVSTTVPLLGGFTGKFIQLILAYGVLLMIPAIPGEVKKAFKVQDSPLGGAALGTFAGGYALGKATVSRAISPYQKEIQATREARLKRRAEQWTAEPNAPLPADAPWYLKMFGRR